MTQTNGIQQANGHSGSLTNYIAFEDSRTGASRIGHYDSAQNTVQPLSFESGTPLTGLYQVINIGEPGIVASREPLAKAST